MKGSVQNGEIFALLKPGDRRTVGRAAEVVRCVLDRAELTGSLVQCVFAEDAAMRMRAADALEKVSRVRPGLLQPFASLLLGLFEETEQQELQWHLALLLPRLRLTTAQQRRVAAALARCLRARSSIARTFALQGMVDLAVQAPALLPMAIENLQAAERTGTAAMKARSRKLLAAVTRSQMVDGGFEI